MTKGWLPGKSWHLNPKQPISDFSPIYNDDSEKQDGSEIGKTSRTCCFLQCIPTYFMNLSLSALRILRRGLMGKLVLVVITTYLFGSLILQISTLANIQNLTLDFSGFESDSHLNDNIFALADDHELNQKLINSYKYAAGPHNLLHNAQNYQFRWNDWVNLSTIISDPTSAPQSASWFSLEESLRVTYNWVMSYSGAANHLKTFAHRERTPPEGQAAVGDQYLDCCAPKPNKFIFLGEKTSTVAVLSPTKPSKWSIFNRRPQTYKVVKQNSNHSEVLVSDLKKPIDDRLNVGVNHDMFRLNLIKMVMPEGPMDQSAPNARANSAKLIESITHVENSDKYFYEIILKNDRAGLGLHYDWRFFRSLRFGAEKQQTLHNLLRAWGQFIEQESIMSWIAHGTLLGWYWNGMSLPWDPDADVQLPVMELDRLARDYNQSVILQHPSEGNGRFFLDVSPWYIQRVRGNGKNVIDARFIDMDTGMYLDITGLAFTSHDNRVTCKNFHFTDIDQILPLRRTLFEGVMHHVPNSFEKILLKEYKHMKVAKFRDYSFSNWMRLWNPTKSCQGIDDDLKKFDSNGDLTLYGACNNQTIWQEYNATKELTMISQMEQKIYSRNELESDDIAVLKDLLRNQIPMISTRKFTAKS